MHLAEEFRLLSVVNPRSCNIGTYNSVICATDNYSSTSYFDPGTVAYTISELSWPRRFCTGLST
jgi:hypothetical protein